MTIDGRPSATGGAVTTPMWRGALAPLLTVLALAVGVALTWYNASSLLLLFSGILVATFFDACTRGLARLVPIARIWRFALVGVVLGVVAALAIAWGITHLPKQARSVIRVIDSQIEVLQSHLTPYGIDLFGPEGREDLLRLIADPGRLFGHVHQAAAGAYTVTINTIVIVFLGLFFAANPSAYREGILGLLPISWRSRVRGVMDEMGRVLRSWLLGQLVRNSILGLTMWAALYFLGLPGAPLLGLMAGVANFIPYLGSLIAAVAVALVAMPLGPPTLVWAMVTYFSIQTIEGYVSAPLIQREAVNVPPAWTLLSIVIFGAMFGVMGVALAAPLLAVGRVAVQRLYVEGWLQDRQGAAGSDH